MRLLYQGPIFGPSGYSKMNRQLIDGLVYNGYKVFVKALDKSDRATHCLSSDDIKRYKSMTYGHPASFDMTLFSRIPNAPMKAKTPSAIYTMIEVESIHPSFFYETKYANKILVPCQWNKDNMKEMTKTPIDILNVSVGNHFFNDNGVRFFNKKPGVFNLLFHGTWSGRKGISNLVRAVSQLGGACHLWVVSRPRHKCGHQAEAHILKNIKDWGGNPEHFTILSDIFMESALPTIYRSADALILPSIGEGWGMPCSEAGACKLPVIASNYSGLTEFLDSDCAWMIEPNKFIRVDQSPLKGVSSFFEKSGMVPLLESTVIAEAIFNCMKNPQQRLEKSEKLFAKMQELTPEKIGKKAISMLETMEIK